MKDKLIVIFLIFFICSPLIYLTINTAIAFSSLQKIRNVNEQSNLEELKKNSRSFKESLQRINPALLLIKPFFVITQNKSRYDEIDNLFSLAIAADSLLEKSIDVVQEVEIITENLKQNPTNNNSTSLTKVQSEIKTLKSETESLEDLLAKTNGQEIIVGKDILFLKKKISTWKVVLETADKIAGHLPILLGATGEKTYLILFQNNMELRPTGGFIGSYGLTTWQNGALKDLEIEDVYNADGQLKGHVEPPAKLKETLGQAGWYLRDSNWDPDFPTSAQRAAWFLEKETGREVDGVVGLNLNVVQAFLKIFGEVEVADYQEKVNEKNFFEKAQYHNEVGFFAGSTAKKNYLSAVYQALSDKSQGASQEQWRQLALESIHLIEKKDITFWFKDNRAAATFGELGWDGGVKYYRCEKVGCLEDYLFVVDANVGVNKADSFLKKNLELETEVAEDGTVKKTLQLIYQNQSPNNFFPGGLYKNYLRIYLPLGSQVISCQIENDDCLPEQTFEHQKKVLGFLVNIPVGEQRLVRLRWILPSKMTGTHYGFLWQKQSGTKDDPVKMTFHYPAGWGMRGLTGSSLTGKSPMIYNTNLSRDLLINLEFQK